MNLQIIGTGYVGLVSGACFAALGHHVTCVDTDAAKVSALEGGHVPIHEPGLDAVIDAGRKAGRLRFTTDVSLGAGDADAVFIAVGTPTHSDDGRADLTQVFAALEAVAPYLSSRAVMVSKSTVPVGTGQRMEEHLSRVRGNSNIPVVSCPEFLREGAAVTDFMRPPRIVVGAESARAID